MKRIIITLIVCLYLSISFAAVTLPKIFTDNMVLQRDKPLRIWGWAHAGESITLSLNGQVAKTKTSRDGTWQIVLAPMKYGGPYEMTINGKNRIILKNILLGDVWICSGQSNMEWLLKNTNDADQEIETSEFSAIRLFTVGKAMGFRPQKDIAGGEWLECQPSTSGDFSAVAYYFGKKLNRDLHIPIGLISSTWGGTAIETWMSWNIMGKEEQYKSVDLDAKEKENAVLQEKQERYNAAMKNDIGDMGKWYESGSDTNGWKPVQLPQLWEQTVIGNTDGNVWFKKEFDLPPTMEGKPITINLGPIDDDDVTYLNGKKIGSIQMYNTDRVYTVDPSFVHQGKNTVVIKVTDNGGGGGLYGKPEQLFVRGSGTKISLAGTWLYKPSTLSSQFGISDAGPNSFPSLLYNAMIAPLTKFAAKGIIWYQGESNIWEAYKYRHFFREMITDWRNQWNDSLSFLWVQIASLLPPVEAPAQSYLAELRESQHKTLDLPLTAEAITIDIGDANDIHPRNKRDVGNRLALTAEHIAYKRDTVYSGPLYVSSTVEGNKMILTFNSMDSGLMVKDRYGYVKGFSIAGSDQKFVWAKAYLEGNKVIVYNDNIANPVAVRYAWSDNPGDANLYNKAGLPASPFRTDEWKGLTDPD